MSVYYNEFNTATAKWLHNLCRTRAINYGTVDGRDIRKIKHEELARYWRVHFFAGIGGWDLALDLAGWPKDREVWTGSCPCQPFSMAGKKRGYADERDLWPYLFRLISERRPTTVFGEQVDNKYGREWLSRLRSDLEGIGYAVGDASVNSAGVGAFQVRQRLYWVANTESPGRCGGVPVEEARGTESGGSGKNLLFGSRPDHRGSSSTLAVGDVCAPSNGIPARMGRLRGYGNAIDPEVAAMFIRAFMEATAS